jgi:glycosyltransferase 2 family protein
MSGVARGLRLLIGLGLMAGLFWYSNPGAVMASLAGASPAWLLASAGLVIVDRVANAYRWLLLLRTTESGRQVPFGNVMRVFFVSGFIGSFLPGSVGGDAVRTVALSRLRVPAADAFASVIVDRMLGVASILVMAAGGLFVVRHLFGVGQMALLLLTTGGGVGLSLLLLFDSRVASAVVAWLTARRFPRLHQQLERGVSAIRQYGAHHKSLGAVLALSVGVQVLRTLEAWALGRALGIDSGLGWYFAFLPVIILVMLLPTSVAGLGTGALAFQLLFGTIGVPAPQSFALAALFAALALIGNLPGGLIFAFDRRLRTTE